AARFSGVPRPKEEAIAHLEKVGLGDKLDRYPNQLSGGEQQRVAIARALVKKPVFVLADEPTGNLDTVKGLEIYIMMKDLSRESKTTFLIVTHNKELAQQVTRDYIHIRDGKIVNEEGYNH
ncbi:MAG: ABC transporter ATP-binding protein, partial [Promethearchaeota archaeon]